VKNLRVSLVVLACVAAAVAAPKPKGEPGKVVDAGAFTVLVDGKKVGLETFKVEQRGNDSFTTSQIKVTDGDKAEQSSELQMNSAGELVHYAWKEISPGKAQSTIEVTQGALLQRIVMPNGKKPVELPHMASPSTFILDDNFFTHRELLAWRYLASCTVSGDKRSCPPMKLGVLIPAQHIMAVVTLELLGTEKVTINGAERELTHIKLMADDIEWGIWVDPADSFKVMRITIPANKTEVVRN
jgi:hypothetical protein